MNLPSPATETAPLAGQPDPAITQNRSGREERVEGAVELTDLLDRFAISNGGDHRPSSR